MKFFIDESGNTGDLIHSGPDLGFDSQPVFTLAAVGIDNQEAASALIARLREKHRLPPGELKSSILKTKTGFLVDVVAGVLELQLPFFIELVDKRYLICANIASTQLVPPGAEDSGLLQRARLGTADFLYDCAPVSLLQAYLDACRADTYEAVEASLAAYASADFLKLPRHANLATWVPRMATEVVLPQLRKHQAADSRAYRKYLPLPDINKRDRLVWMLPNLSSLTNAYARINRFRGRRLKGVQLIHDEQSHFDKILADAKAAAEALQALARQMPTPFSDYEFDEQAELLFGVSDDHVGLQIADLLAGISMRAVRDHLCGHPDGALLEAFRALVAVSNQATSVGVNMVVPQRVHTAL